MAGVAADVAGEAGVDTNVAPLMGGEDFSYMLHARPGAYIFVGNGDTAGVHHPAYDFNDEAAPYGVSLWAKIVETACRRSRRGSYPETRRAARESRPFRSGDESIFR